MSPRKHPDARKIADQMLRRSLGRVVAVPAFVGLLFAAGCAFEFSGPDKLLSAQFDGTKAELSQRGTKNTLDLSSYISARSDYAYTVLFANQRGDFSYLLLDVSGRSSPDASGPCAKGSEQNLIWLKLDKSLQIQGANSVLVESCFDNLQIQQGYKLSEDKLTLKFRRTSVGSDGTSIASGQSESLLTYDNAHPGDGMKVETLETK